MSRIPIFTLPLFISSIMSSTDYGSQSVSTVFGQVLDEDGLRINGADVLIESATDRRQTISSTDGSFFSDIYIGGAFDEIFIRALYGMKTGSEKACAHGGHIRVEVVVKELKK